MKLYEVAFIEDDFEDGRTLADVADHKHAATQFCELEDDLSIINGETRTVKVREIISNTESGEVLMFKCSGMAIPTYSADQI